MNNRFFYYCLEFSFPEHYLTRMQVTHLPSSDTDLVLLPMSCHPALPFITACGSFSVFGSFLFVGLISLFHLRVVRV